MLEQFREQWASAPIWQKLLVAIILPTVVAGAIWFYMIKPTVERKKAVEAEIAQLQQEINQLKGLIQPGIIAQLEKELANLKELEKKTRLEVERVVGKIPTEGEIEKILGEINFLAGVRNLVITSITISSPQVMNLMVVKTPSGKVVRQAGGGQGSGGVPVKAIRISMNLEGKTQDLYLFLESLQKKGLVSFPRSLAITPVEREGRVKAQMSVDIIVQM